MCGIARRCVRPGCEYVLHMGMTRAFHAGSTGSNPVRGTTENASKSQGFREVGGVGGESAASASPSFAGNRLQNESHSPRWVMVSACVLLFVFAGFVMVDEASAAKLHPDRSCRVAHITASKAIECYWPRHSRAKAHRVAECESTASASERIARRRSLGRWARNGQYVGIMQMGVRERRAHGWYRRGDPARVQVWSAIRLFRSRGWQPWSCA